MADNPDAFPSSANTPIEQTLKPRFSIVKLLLVLAIGAVLLAMLLPNVRRAGPATRRVVCKNNFRQIAVALFNYESDYGAFPPACTVNIDGKPLHSWRTLILPYLDERILYSKIDLSKPWDDPANEEAYKAIPSVYRCPSTESPRAHTTYLAIVTPNSCLRPAEPRQLSEITDGPSNTWIVIEAPPANAVPWMAPTDADEHFMSSFGAKTKFAHAGGMHVLLADGSVRFVSASLPVADRLALISISGKEKPPDF